MVYRVKQFPFEAIAIKIQNLIDLIYLWFVFRKMNFYEYSWEKYSVNNVVLIPDVPRITKNPKLLSKLPKSFYDRYYKNKFFQENISVEISTDFLLERDYDEMIKRLIKLYLLMLEIQVFLKILIFCVGKFLRITSLILFWRL